MEIRQVLRGNNTGFAPARPAGSGGKKTDGFVRPSADRLELSQSWVGAMEEQRVQAESALLAGAKKKSDGILDMLDGPDAERALSDGERPGGLQAGHRHAAASEEGRQGVRKRPEG